MEDLLARHKEIKATCAIAREIWPEEKWPELVKEPVFRGRNKELVPDQFALSNGRTGETYSFVTSDYQILRHEEVALSMLRSAEALESKYGKATVTHRFLNGGAKYICKVSFSSQVKPVKVGDIVAPSLSIKNSYDKTWARDLAFGATQLVCTNGLVRPKVTTQNKRKHVNGCTIEEINTLTEGFLTETFPEMLDTWHKWTETEITLKEINELFEKFPLSSTEREKAMGMPLIGSNESLLSLADRGVASVWDVNRAATQFYTHEVKSEIRVVTEPESVSRILVNFVK